jgi:GT2 family glycosyltransferase
VQVAVIIPTLAADDALAECLAALAHQTARDFEVIVIDNSGQDRVHQSYPRVLRAPRNLGYGAAINWGVRESKAEFIAVINDDTAAEPEWLSALLSSMKTASDVGMCASLVLETGTGRIDSAGMLLCRDGSTKQRGQGERPEKHAAVEEALFPSGSAALYRRAMLEQIGGFDESFFLYCEDSDLGLRARWAGWRCLYVPQARVHHRYSHSAGRASALKAYYVERNRLFLSVKNLPARLLLALPFHTAARYWYHLTASEGVAADYRRTATVWQLVWFAVKAHIAMLGSLPRLLLQRRSIHRNARISTNEFISLARRFRISAREVASR